MVKIFGREPALVIALVNAVIMFGGTLGFHFLSLDQAGLWVLGVNAVSAAILAWATRPLSPAVFSYALASVIGLAAGYGLQVTPEQVNGLNLLVVPILAFLTRGQVSPVETAVTQKSLDPTKEAAAHEAGNHRD
jgi:hypothetical protein